MRFAIKDGLTWEALSQEYLRIINCSQIEQLHEHKIIVIIAPSPQDYYALASLYWPVLRQHVQQNFPGITHVHVMCLDRPGEPLRCSVANPIY